MKLSKSQKYLLIAMASGGELRRATTAQGGFWMRGSIKSVNSSTAYALYKLGLIDWEWSFPYTPVYLTEMGLAIATELMEVDG